MRLHAQLVLVVMFLLAAIISQALQPLFAEDEDDGTRDNATGAVARMLLAAGAALPLEQVGAARSSRS